MKKLTLILLMAVIALPFAWSAPSFSEEKDAKTEKSTEAAEQVKEDTEEEEEPEDPEKAALNKSLGKFYMALNSMLTGNVEPMTEVWSHAEDVTYLPPDGTYLVGWEDVLKNWQEQAALNLGGSVRPMDINYNIGTVIAVVQNYEVGSNMVDGQKITIKIRATNTFRKEDGEWKMIGHHTDVLPFLIQAEEQEN